VSPYHYNLIDLLSDLPHGPESWSHDVDRLVQTSSNLAIVRSTGAEILAILSFRSMSDEDRDGFVAEVEGLVHEYRDKFGVEVNLGDGYPAWTPNHSSPLLSLAKETYRKLTGQEPILEAIHAGLEPGLLGQKYEGLDSISFGPLILGAHEPEEALSIASTQDFYKYLLALLERFSRPIPA